MHLNYPTYCHGCTTVTENVVQHCSSTVILSSCTPTIHKYAFDDYRISYQ